MNIHLYAKSDMDISFFDGILSIITEPNDKVDIIVENRRSFRELEKLKSSISVNDIIVIQNLNDLGSNNVDIANRLDWFVHSERFLVIGSIDSTYKYGITQPMNKAVLSTLLQQLLSSDSNILTMHKKVSVGRNRAEFPDNWEELYQKWDRKEISSKEFIEESGLKKATFYNLVTEYKMLQQINHDYIEKYKRA